MLLTIQIDDCRRIRVFVPEGGLQLECSDSVIAAHLDSAAAALSHASQNLIASY